VPDGLKDPGPSSAHDPWAAQREAVLRATALDVAARRIGELEARVAELSDAESARLALAVQVMQLQQELQAERARPLAWTTRLRHRAGRAARRG
jgi:hypothetical protein